MRPQPVGIEGKAVLWMAFSAGLVDAIGFLAMSQLFVAHMSGNSVIMASLFGEGQWMPGLQHLFAIAIFLVALFTGYLWVIIHPGPKGLYGIFWLEAALLGVFGLITTLWRIPAPDEWPYYLMAVLPLTAMGLQNTTLKRLGPLTVHTTYVTGTLDSLCENAAHATLWLRAEIRRSGSIMRPLLVWHRQPPTLAACRVGLLWFSYLMGALLGGFGLVQIGAGIVFVPTVVLFALGAVYAGARKKR